MCSRIVEGNHGGRIFIDSKKGQGTSILVWLPDSVIVSDSEEPIISPVHG
jgi:signal transduction histidine kinase